MPGAEQPLTAKQDAFCLEYTVDWNGSAAARRAGYAESSARQIASELLRDPRINARIDELAAEKAGHVRIIADNILRELQYIADHDPASMFAKGEDGTFLPIPQMPEPARRALAGFEIKQTFVGEDSVGLPVTQRITKLKFCSKEKALELLGKYRKLFVDRVEHEGEVRAVTISIDGRKRE